MLELKGDYYYNSIEINNLVTNEILEGKIFINDDGWCEGFINFGSEKHLIVGIFRKNENLELYEITENSIYKYIASKGYLQYDGYFQKQDDDDYQIPFTIKCHQQRQDPRDNYCMDEINFLQELLVLKNELFKNKQIQNKYNNILSNKDKIKNRVFNQKVKQYKMVV